MSRSFSIDQSALDAQASKLRRIMESKARRIRDRLPEPLRVVAAETAGALAERTFPSSQAIGLAVAALRHDFSLVYASPSKAYKILEESNPQTAKAFYSAWKRGDLARAGEIIRSSGTSIASIQIGRDLDPSLRDKYRNKNGRVVVRAPLQLVTSEQYSAALQVALLEIGKTASGWLACAQKLGGDGNVIKWKGIAIHGSEGGDIQLQITEFGARLILHNRRPLARKHISPSQVAAIREAARNHMANLMKDLVRSSQAA